MHRVSNNMKTSFYLQRRLSAFSLVEVVVAVGIFAISIVGVIGLLGPTNKSVSDVRDTDDATRVVTAIQAQLQTMAMTGYFTTVGANKGVGSSASGSTDGFMQASAPADPVDGNGFATTTTPTTPSTTINPTYGPYTIYASKDGAKIGAYGSTVWGSSPTTAASNASKFFEIVLIRNTALSANTNVSTADTTAGFLAYTIRLRWPAFNGNGVEFTAHTQKNVILFPGAVHR